MSLPGCSADCRMITCTEPNSYLDTESRTCYWRTTASTSRDAATSVCGPGGRLARWGSIAEQQRVYDRIVTGSNSREVWVGLKVVGGQWQWDDGTPATTAEVLWMTMGGACAYLKGDGSLLVNALCSRPRVGRTR